jgi:conjugal transfer pilus assembly protein TraV
MAHLDLYAVFNKETRMNIGSIALALAVTACLAACASTPKGKFQCPAPEGVACMGVDELYEATNYTDRVVGRNTPTLRQPAARVTTVQDLAFDAPRRSAVNQLPTQVPVRMQPRVMRVWLAPWEDDDGDLVMASYVYSEIAPRRWSVGERGLDTVTGSGMTYRLDPPPSSQ